MIKGSTAAFRDSNPYGFIRSTYREDGIIKHETLSCITGVPLTTLKLIQAAFQGNVVLKLYYKILQSKEYGASGALRQIVKIYRIGQSHLLLERTMGLGCSGHDYRTRRLAGSKLSLTGVGYFSSLWELYVVTDAKIDVNQHC